MPPPEGYKPWDADQPGGPEQPGYSPYEDAPAESRDWVDVAGGAAKGAGYGAGIGAGAYILRGLFRRAFPGAMPRTSALKRIDQAIKKGESSSGLKDMFGRYMREVAQTNKPITFADYVAQQPGHQATAATIRDLISNSGKISEIDERLADRAAGSKDRVLDDVSRALGVPKESVVMGKDALIAQRKARAQPLYDAAFADDRPIKDTRFYRLFEAPAARQALSEAVRNAENRLSPIDVRSASSPTRRDWWKFLPQDAIPEGLFLDEEGPGGLRRYIAPNLRNADAIQKALRQKMESAMVTDPVTGYTKHTEASRALKELHDRFMQTMYDVAPNDEYRAARSAYAGDSRLLEAHRQGSELLTMKPDEVRKVIAGMGPDERTALAQGFYGSLNDMNHQKFLRELVARPERYPERREVLSAVFQDPAKLQQFMDNLKGEEAMADSAATYGNAPPSRDAGPRLPAFRINAPLWGMSGMDPRAQLIEYLRPETEKWIPRGIGRMSRAGTDIMFREPRMGRRSVSHPDWNFINDMRLSPSEQLGEFGTWSGLGALGGLGIYGAAQVPDPLDSVDK